MSGPQFIHLETHARVRSKLAGKDATRPIDEIIREAAREPSHSSHVVNPISPEVLFHTLDELRGELTKRVDDAELIRGRKIRRDSRIMVSVICSHPTPMSVIDENILCEWIKSSIDWAKHWGENNNLDLYTVVIHGDEKQPHLHMYLLPRADDGMEADKCHPGKAAKTLVLAQARAEGNDWKAATRRANRAYTIAMRAFQDSYYKDVSLPMGMTRLGPRRNRLSRSDWAATKARAERLAEVLRSAQNLLDREADNRDKAAELDSREAALKLEAATVAGQVLRLGEARQQYETACQAIKLALAAMADHLDADYVERLRQFIDPKRNLAELAVDLEVTSPHVM
ncbi:plasmid recombination protein [Nitrospirillum sp. BR 11752]|uniref:plasmid recombination protein n=1 Tax=Nitrospirillum sp. BR 11752 TaxID=3104293 RepID=UPI002E99E874|nr:plasmid recombination protein [Nitrospirillum sp. BR 11752]